MMALLFCLQTAAISQGPEGNERPASLQSPSQDRSVPLPPIPYLFSQRIPGFDENALVSATLADGPGDFLLRGRSQAGSDKDRPRSQLYLSMGLVFAAGALGFWSKNEADSAYDRYLSSASASRQTDNFDRAVGYDRVSGAAFVAMEIGIVLTSYFLFF